MGKPLKRKFEIANVSLSTMYVDHEFFIPTTGNVQNLYTDNQLYQQTAQSTLSAFRTWIPKSLGEQKIFITNVPKRQPGLYIY